MSTQTVSSLVHPSVSLASRVAFSLYASRKETITPGNLAYEIDHMAVPGDWNTSNAARGTLIYMIAAALLTLAVDQGAQIRFNPTPDLIAAENDICAHVASSSLLAACLSTMAARHLKNFEA